MWVVLVVLVLVVVRVVGVGVGGYMCLGTRVVVCGTVCVAVWMAVWMAGAVVEERELCGGGKTCSSWCVATLRMWGVQSLQGWQAWRSRQR